MQTRLHYNCSSNFTNWESKQFSEICFDIKFSTAYWRHTNDLASSKPARAGYLHCTYCSLSFGIFFWLLYFITIYYNGFHCIMQLNHPLWVQHQYAMETTKIWDWTVNAVSITDMCCIHLQLSLFCPSTTHNFWHDDLLYTHNIFAIRSILLPVVSVLYSQARHGTERHFDAIYCRHLVCRRHKAAHCWICSSKKDICGHRPKKNWHVSG